MAKGNEFQVRIDSILGGISRFTNFSADDEFLSSVNIDPTSPVVNYSAWGTARRNGPSGLIAPIAVENLYNGTTGAYQTPVAIVPTPKSNVYFIYGAGGSVYTYEWGVFSSLSDGDSMGGVSFGDAAYNDNYVYFSKNTTIARYGPLDGTPAFDGDYWGTTLSKPAMTDYSTFLPGFLRHISHRHSDGRLYIADMSDGRGVLHYISTKKTTVEGDTDNESTYGKLYFPYGYVPTAIESYGSNLAIALFEGPVSSIGVDRGQRAKIAIWDTVSQNYNLITNDEFPDQIITSMKNVNGVLHIASGSTEWQGFRVSRYIGGYSFEEIFYGTEGYPPPANSMITKGDRLIFGSDAVYSIGLPGKSGGVFKYYVGNTIYTDNIYCLAFSYANTFERVSIFAGWIGVSTDTFVGLDVINTYGDYSAIGQEWSSRVFKIGQPGKIKKVRIPLAQPLGSAMSINVFMMRDDGESLTPNTGVLMGTISSAYYGLSTQSIVIKPENASFDNNFYLSLTWSGEDQCIVSLPITISGELSDIDSISGHLT